MSSQVPCPHHATSAVESVVIRKLRLRILPLVFVLYAVAFLDRANVSYAKLTMSDDLGFSEAVFGLGAGLFFVGYFLLEVPGALIVERWGARVWTARILITWGICTVLVGWVRNAQEFYVARFALGAAEAGFFPGMVIHLNHWFPKRFRAGALACFVVASPIALTLGGPLSGWILTLDWWGIAGWRWIFFLQGLPAVVLGVVTLFLMTDRPHQAKWLKPEERAWLLSELEHERQIKLASGKVTTLDALRKPVVMGLALIVLLANIGTAGFFLWLPTTIQKASGLSPSLSATLSGLPFLAAILSVLTMSWSSDRTGERCWHTAIPLLMASVVFPVTSLPELPFGALLFFLCVSSAAIYGFGPSFWVLPTLTLGESAAAAAVGWINSCGALGGFVGPTVVGAMLTNGQSFRQAVCFLSGCFLLAGLLTIYLRKRISGPANPTGTLLGGTSSRASEVGGT